MTFNQYVKLNYDKVRHLPNNERLKALSKIYNTEKMKIIAGRKK